MKLSLSWLAMGPSALQHAFLDDPKCERSICSRIRRPVIPQIPGGLHCLNCARAVEQWEARIDLGLATKAVEDLVERRAEVPADIAALIDAAAAALDPSRCPYPTAGRAS